MNPTQKTGMLPEVKQAVALKTEPPRISSLSGLSTSIFEDATKFRRACARHYGEPSFILRRENRYSASMDSIQAVHSLLSIIRLWTSFSEGLLPGLTVSVKNTPCTQHTCPGMMKSNNQAQG